MSISPASVTHPNQVPYLACAGITFLLWDSFLTLPIELRHIWKKSSSWLLQVAFFLNRYGVAISLSVYIMDSISFVERSDNTCRRSAYTLALLVCLSDVTGNALTIFRIFIIWDRRAQILRLLLIGVVLSSGCSMTFVILIAWRDAPSTSWNAVIRSCSLTKTSVFFVTYFVPQIAFDIYAALLVLFNSVAIPRTPGDSLLKMLYEDGIVLIGIAFLLRIADVFINTQGPASYLITMTFVPSVISVLNTRMVLMVCENRRKRAEALALEDGELIEIDLHSNAGDSWSHISS